MESLHIRLEFNEALAEKKNLLHTEMHLLNLVGVMRKYSELRNNESIKRVAIKNKLRLALSNINSFKKIVPKVHEKKEEEIRIREMIEQPKTHSLEQELREIQKKLEKMG